MARRTYCQRCRRLLRLPDEVMGAFVDCPCGNRFRFAQTTEPLASPDRRPYYRELGQELLRATRARRWRPLFRARAGPARRRGLGIVGAAVLAACLWQLCWMSNAPASPPPSDGPALTVRWTSPAPSHSGRPRNPSVASLPPAPPRRPPAASPAALTPPRPEVLALGGEPPAPRPTRAIRRTAVSVHAPEPAPAPAPEPGQQGPRATEFFGQRLSLHQAVVSFLLDASGSMNLAADPFPDLEGVLVAGNKLARACMELRRCLEGSDAPARFNVYLFSDECRGFKPRAVGNDAQTRVELAEWLEGAKARGTTRTADAVREALAAGEAGALVLLSDGLPSSDDRSESTSRAALVQRARIAGDNPRGIPIHCYGLDVDERGRAFLEGVAEDSGGRFRAVSARR